MEIYTIEWLSKDGWLKVGSLLSRKGTITQAQASADADQITRHVYLLTKNGVRKHVFCAYPRKKK